ncbi:Sec7 domain family protein [Leishmania donovani]|uniref:Sec7 domain family protein n=1 Tax=Leishmania donovani TaxID=5661 RepID=A0A504XL78_LEIDO|nr:Sec7 domain family protein [Leishmania donovani]
MRTSNRLNYRSSPLKEKEASEYAVAQELLDLQRRLFAGAVPVPGRTSSSSSVHPSPQGKSNPACACSTEALPDLVPLALPDSYSKHGEVSEVAILSAFANVCRSPNTSAVVTGVALTALVDMLDLPCAFVSMYGVYAAIEAASETRAEVHDSASHEVLLSRIFSVYVAALNHPAAVMADGGVHVRALGRMMVLATHPEASQLLKRTVEKSMRLIVMTLFRRLLHLPADEDARRALVAAGVTVLRFISRLISGDIACFDNDGHEVASTVAFGGSEGLAGTSASGGSGDDKTSPLENTITLIQLEGLALAQDCLLLLRCSLSKPLFAPLLDTVQNQLCRALLIAGVGTMRTIVLAQTLRTVHLVMQGSSVHLIPQIYNFIRVLHLNPLEALANELADAGAVQPGSPVGRSGSPVASRPPASPVSTASSGHGNSGRLSAQQLQRKQERRDILLESLAEFCSDPRFGSFCFIHYDLSWRYASLLPQLYQVLANHVYPVFHGDPEEVATAAWSQRRSGMAGDRKAAAQRRQRAAAAVDYRRDRRQRSMAARRLPRSTQRTALDATTNMVSGIAIRAIASGALPSTAAESDTTICAGSPSTSLAELQRLIQHAQKEKDKLNYFASLFEDSPIKKGIPFLLEHAIRVPAGAEEETSLKHCTKLVLAEPAGGRELGEALYRLSIVLNKRVLGDYIGEQGRNQPEDVAAAEDATRPAALFSVRFFEEQLDGFIHQFEFHNKPLLDSIREMVFLLCLPGESQKIDRVMESFAKHWYQQNVTYREDGTLVKDETLNPFHSDSGAFVAQQMKREDFVKMNRGIDDGKDIPAAYLGSIYDDVRQHEVVMAEMMDRGFANDTTWRLEMQPCLNFVHHALSAAAEVEKAEAVKALTTILSHELGAATAAATAGSTVATARMRDPESGVLQIFDLLLFQSLWKRSLLVFDGMLASAVDEVSLSIVATGDTIARAVEEAEQQLPAEMAILQSSLRGVCLLARAAHALSLPVVADQCFMGLLKYVVMSDLTNAEEEVRALYRSIFALLVDIYSSLEDSWLPLSRLILDMQLVGLFAEPAQAAARGRPKPRGADDGDAEASDSRAAQRSVSAPTEPLHVLLQDPGIYANVFAPLSAASAAGDIAAEQKAASERGWFSSLFGGSGALQVSTVQLSELRDALGRIGSCIPNMRRLLSILQRVSADPNAAQRCLCSLSAVSSIEEDIAGSSGNGVNSAPAEGEGKKGNGHPSGLDEASAYAASYELAFICAVVGGAATTAVLQPAHFASLTTRVSRLLREVDVYLHDTRASDGVRAYWCTLGNRVVCASLQLMAVHWRGQHGAVAMEQLWACWMRAAPSTFAFVVARPVAAFLYDQVVVLNEAEKGAGPGEKERDAMQPWASGSEVLVLLAPFAVHAAAVSDVVVQRQIGSLLLHVVQQRRYSVSDDTESIVSLCLSFSVWMRHSRAAGSSTAVGDTPESNEAALTKAKCGAVATTSLPSGASVAEVLGLCGRNVLLDNAGTAAGGAGAERGEWCSLWVFVLRSLGALALCSSDARDGSEAILCLQRAIADWSAVGRREKGRLGENSGAAASFSRSVLGSLVNSLVSPVSPERNGQGESMASVVGASALSRRSAPPTLVFTEVKCRLLSLVPKVLLRYTAALTTQPDLLLSLWRRVLGTLYAVHSAYPVIEDAAGHGMGAEAVEETVKNMIYVVASTWQCSSSSTVGSVAGTQQQHAAAFWAAIVRFLQPFSFSAPLVDFMVQAGLVRIEAGAEAAIAPDAAAPAG